MIFYFLFLIFLKHWLADFVFQNQRMLSEKGIYGARGGIDHAIGHGVATTLILTFFMPYIVTCIIFGLIDSIVHYHIDFIKAHYGTKDISTKEFWDQLGLDQFAHAVFYIWLSWAVHTILD
jgi:hypothetical protein